MMSALRPDIDNATLRQIGQGTLRGGLSDNGALTWRGIPYAAPPVGELRWRAPRPAPRFAGGELLAVEHGQPCVQDLSLAAPFQDHDADGFVGSEDCLYLNVYAPAGSSSADRLPVMYFIHGGGNVGGHNAATTYDGSVLAERERVIVVTINYRLGLLGWFMHPALIEPDASPEDRSGNWGTLDIIRGLHWVRENVAAFGGDADNVTIFGESAGGVNVYSLLVSPLAKGLFHRAIAQSGGVLCDTMASACHYADDPEPGSPNSARELFNRLLLRTGQASDAATAKALQNGMPDRAVAQLLRQATPAELIGLANPERLRLYAAPRVLRDGHVLPKESWLSAFSAGRFHRVPLITGTNRDERRLYQFLEPRWRKTMRETPRDYVLYAKYGSLAWKQRAVDDVARAMLHAGHREVYAYRFDWDEQGTVQGFDMSLAVGAGHAVELPFVFGTSSSLTPGLSGVTDESRGALSASMTSYWAQLAYAGAPGQGRDGRQPEWQPWHERDGEPCLMLFDSAADGGVRMSAERIDHDALKRAVLEEQGFLSPGLHAQLYRGLFAASGFDETEYRKLTSRV